jgi:hypothetical protein
MFICEACGRFYQMCLKCNPDIPCQFLGCGLIGTNYRKELRGDSDRECECPYENPADNPELGGNMTEELMQTSPHYLSFVDRNVTYVKNEDIESITGEKMTGPDGGNYLYWRCNQCHHIFNTCDK